MVLYNARFKTCLRIQAPVESLMVDDKAKGAELWLAVLDTYSSLSDCVQGNIPSDPKVAEKVREKFLKIIVLRYPELSQRIVGRLRGWTKALLIYTVVALAGTLSTQLSIIPNNIRKFMRDEKLRVTSSYDVDDWTLTDTICALHTLECRWNNKATAWKKECAEYLRYIEAAVDRFITSASPLYMVDYAAWRGGKDPYNLTPECMQTLVSKVVSLRRSLVVRDIFKVRRTVVPDNNYVGWQKEQERHLTTRKFRQVVLNVAWQLNLRPSEQDIGAYARKAEISAHNSILNTRSLDLCDMIGEIVTYKDMEDMNKDSRVCDALVLSQVQATMMGSLAIDWKQYFFLREDKILKHIEARVTAPYICQRLSRFDTVHKGVVYTTPQGTLSEAFVVWCSLVKEEGGILYGGFDFNLLLSVMFPEKNANINEGFNDVGDMFLSYGT